LQEVCLVKPFYQWKLASYPYLLALDFCVPDETHSAVVIEAKLTSDDGTARDKVARIKELKTQRNQHVAEGRPFYEVVAKPSFLG
jgi:hypothetical protein